MWLVEFAAPRVHALHMRHLWISLVALACLSLAVAARAATPPSLPMPQPLPIAPSLAIDAQAVGGLGKTVEPDYLFRVRNAGSNPITVAATCSVAKVTFVDTSRGTIMKPDQQVDLRVRPADLRRWAALPPGTYPGTCSLAVIGPKGAVDQNPRNNEIKVSVRIAGHAPPPAATAAPVPATNEPPAAPPPPPPPAPPFQETILASLAVAPTPGGARVSVLIDENGMAVLGSGAVAAMQDLIAAVNTDFLSQLGGGPGVPLQLQQVRTVSATSMGYGLQDTLSAMLMHIATFREAQQAELADADLTLVVTGNGSDSSALSFVGSICNPHYSVMVGRAGPLTGPMRAVLLAHIVGHSIGFQHVDGAGVESAQATFSGPFVMSALPTVPAGWSASNQEHFGAVAPTLVCLGD